MRAILLVAACSCALVTSAPVASAQDDVPATLRIDATICDASWFDLDAFARALSVELVVDGMRVEDDGVLALVVDVPCDADAVVTLRIDDAQRTISLSDVAHAVRMRTLALAAHDFVSAAARRRSSEPSIVLAPEETEPIRGDDASALGDPSDLAPDEPPTIVTARWLALGATARAVWLGLRVVAPMISLEGEGRVLGTPIALWIAIDGLYAVGTDGLGEVHAFDVGGRAGARVVLELDPLALSVSVGVLAAYARAQGVSDAARARSLEGALVGIDVALAGSLAVSEDVRLSVSLGLVGYVMGLEARAEERPIVSFRDVAPWASLGVLVDLPAS